MKVAILTTFADFDRSYSLCGVALEQAAILLENEVDFDLFVNEKGSRLNEASIDAEEWISGHVRKGLPTDVLKEDVIHDGLRQRTEDWLRGVLPEYDVVITHDMMFTTWFVTYNQAIRNVAPDFPKVTWVHWVHSAPSDRPARLLGATALRYTAAPNSIYVYLNEEDRRRYAESLGVDIGQVMVCYNPLDAASYYGADAETAAFIREHKLWDHDLMQVYPISMPRANAKGLSDVIGIFGEWKRLGYKVKLVVVNAHCTAEAEKKSVNAYGQMAKLDWSLSERDLVFTSTKKEWEYSVPHDAVRALFRLSNVFVFPTQSEACSRVLQEASLAGCLVVGNESFPPMNEFLTPIVQKYTFGSLRYTVNFDPGKNQWLRNVARSLTPQIDHPVMKQKTHMMHLAARETIWREQLLPILERAVQLARERAVLA